MESQVPFCAAISLLVSAIWFLYDIYNSLGFINSADAWSA
jgi:hypothetical protein